MIPLRVAAVALLCPVLFATTGCALLGEAVGTFSFSMSSESMLPTVEKGARLTVRRAVGGYVPRPGDVVVFTPADWTGITPDAGHVSRVIGVPGSTVVCCDSQGRLEVNGKALDEPYLALPPASHVPFSVLVPAGRLWMMSDNRHVALDSRAHRGDPGEGTVAVSDVDGQVSLPVR
ncbi:signal peptidase I [Nonomuraea antimicrobica]|uniref:signal peptidase I n=1 Tax=Nonomuraea antimicrobica TaxID=561173 RepID=UPI0031F12B26